MVVTQVLSRQYLRGRFRRSKHFIKHWFLSLNYVEDRRKVLSCNWAMNRNFLTYISVDWLADQIIRIASLHCDVIYGFRIKIINSVKSILILLLQITAKRSNNKIIKEKQVWQDLQQICVIHSFYCRRRTVGRCIRHNVPNRIGIGGRREPTSDKARIR